MQISSHALYLVIGQEKVHKFTFLLYFYTKIKIMLDIDEIRESPFFIVGSITNNSFAIIIKS